MRFLHTADWQIGMKAAHLGEKAGAVREERLLAARRVVKSACEHQAEFILLAGDTFEDNGVNRGLVASVAHILAEAAMPVHIIPGNHDPLVPGSVWDCSAWKSAANVRIHRDSAFLDIPAGRLYPCPVRMKHSDKNPTAWIHADPAQGICIGLAHGSLEGYLLTEKEYPIPSDAPAGEGAKVRMAYSGTHETASFSENESGNALLVDIASPGAAPAIKRLRTGRFRWLSKETKVTQSGDLERFLQEIRAITEPQDTLLDLRLSGLLLAEDRRLLDELQALLRDRFFHGRLDDAGLHPAPKDDDWIEGAPAGILRQAAERLRRYADPGFSELRPEGASPQVASAALREFYALLSEDQA
jgi:hypothetical protein